MNFIFLFLIILATAFADDPVMTIVSARWAGTPVTKIAKEFCDGKASCDYKVSVDRLGDPKDTDNQSFTIKWKCTSSKIIHSYTEANDATDKTFTIECKAPVKVYHPQKGHPKSTIYENSFKRMVLSKNSLDLFPACRKALRTFYQKEGRLISTLINQNTNVVNNLVLYHHTKSQDMLGVSANQIIYKMFEFIRKTPGTSMWNSLVYGADDTKSSASYGPFILTIHLKDKIKVLDEFSYNGETDAEDALSTAVVREVARKHPSLKSCHKSLDEKGQEVEDTTSLYYFAIEEMGIDVIHYRLSIAEGHWYQIITPYAVDYIE
jgi:hypothetical protein